MAVLPGNSDTSIKRIKHALSEEGMISLRKISFLVRQHQKDGFTAHQLCRLAKVSKSIFYRVVKSYSGLSYHFMRKRLLERKPPSRSPRQVPIEHVQAVLQKRIETRANDRLLARMLEKDGTKVLQIDKL